MAYTVYIIHSFIDITRVWKFVAIAWNQRKMSILISLIIHVHEVHQYLESRS